ARGSPTPPPGARCVWATSAPTRASACPGTPSASSEALQEVAHRAVEGLRLIAVGEMTGRREQGEAGVGNPLLDLPHGAERGVLVAAYEEGGRGDLPETVGDVVHLEEGPQGVGVADGREHPVVVEDL